MKQFICTRKYKIKAESLEEATEIMRQDEEMQFLIGEDWKEEK